MLFWQSCLRFHDMCRVLPVYWFRISTWEMDVVLIQFFVVSCLGRGLPTADSFFKEYWQIFTRRFRSTGYGFQWSALASSAPEIYKCTARKPYPYKQRQLSFCGNNIKFYWNLLFYGMCFHIFCKISVDISVELSVSRAVPKMKAAGLPVPSVTLSQVNLWGVFWEHSIRVYIYFFVISV